MLSVDNPNSLAEVEQLIKEGQHLQKQLGDLSGMLRQMASQLEQGTPPTAGTTSNMIETSRAFETWHEQAQKALGGSLIEPVLPKVLEALEQHKHQLEQANLRHKALQALEHISSLAHRDSEEFMPLSTIQFDAVGMMRALRDSSMAGETSQALAQGHHPYNALLRLILDSEMSNLAWFESFKTVSEQLNQDLAIAAARGHISLPEL